MYCDNSNFSPARRGVLRGMAITACALATGTTHAQRRDTGSIGDFPARALTVIVPWAAGGGGDVAVRMLGQALSARVNQPVVVENRGGATGTIGSSLAARSRPDGYTLVYATADSHFVFPHLYRQAPYDPLRDFSAVAPIGYFQFGLAVHPSVPARDAQEFLALLRCDPGRYSYGTWGIGSTAQLLMENYKVQHDLDVLHVPYQGTAPELLGLVSGQVDAAILPMQITDGYVQSGQIRLLGLGSPERDVSLPELPTLTEQGMTLDLRSAVGLLGPAGVAQPVLAWLNRAISEVMRNADVQAKLRAQYIVPQVLDLAQYQAFLQHEYQRWGEVVRNAKVSVE